MLVQFSFRSPSLIQPSLRSISQKRTLSTAGRTKHSRIMAAQSILTKANAAILQAHVSCCVREAVESGNAEEKLAEINSLLQKLLK